jgi:hypothetical protein
LASLKAWHAPETSRGQRTLSEQSATARPLGDVVEIVKLKAFCL